VLSLLTLMALAGCPNWDAERTARCLALDAGTGVCERLDAGDAGGAGGGATGGGGALGGGGGGTPDAGDVDSGVDQLPALRENARLQTYGNTNDVRLPVFLWEVRRTGLVVAVETSAAGFSLWRAGDQGAAGSATHTWCASAANDEATLVGSAYENGANHYVAVDDVDAGNLNSSDYPLAGCPQALAASRGPDGGVYFLGISPFASNLRIERASCVGCAVETTDVPLGAVKVGEAVTDAVQSTWISAASGLQQKFVYAIELSPAGASVTHFVADAGASQHVELTTSGRSVHAAWLEGLTLTFAALSTDGGQNALSTIVLPEAARLVDVVEGRIQWWPCWSSRGVATRC
jgi:hypothetical protein